MDDTNDVVSSAVNNVVGSDMGDALSSILSNPEIMSKISAIAGSLSGDSGGAVADAPPPGNAAPSGLASALSNPQLLSKLPQVMATLAPMLSGNNGGNGEVREHGDARDHSVDNDKSEQKSAQKGDAPSGNVAASAPVTSIKTDVPCRAHRTALLCALKPYMSPRRREAIDYIIKIDRIGDLLHTLT